MAEYIDREEAKKWVATYALEKYHVDITQINPDAKPRIAAFYGLYEAYNLLNEVPAADVRLERHGEWDDSDGEHTKCSICGYFAPIIPQYQDEPITWDAPFCPHCGAKMDGKGGEGDG